MMFVSGFGLTFLLLVCCSHAWLQFQQCAPGIPHLRRQSTILPLSTRESDSGRTYTTCSRRDVFFGLATGAALPFISVPAAIAVDDESVPSSGLVSSEKIAVLLRAVPTFTIVDQKGVPFMVVGEDAKVTGYFFTEYEECQRVLDLARKSAGEAIAGGKKDPEKQPPDDELIIVNPWLDARISSVPLDFAATLVTKTLFGGRFSRGNYFQVAPSEKDVEDALAITGKDDLLEGKVPLFYMKDFELKNGLAPLYFSKDQLESAYKKENPGKPIPDVQVTELFAVLLEMVRPDGKDTDLQKLVFVPRPGSDKQVKECERNGRNESAFQLGQRIVVL